MELHRINSLSDLKELLSLLREFDIHDFEIEMEGRKLRVGKGKVEAAPNFAFLPGAMPAVGPAAAAPAGAVPGEEESAPSLPPGVSVVTSPMVGTFYRASSPEADPFASEGDRVSADSVLCIIEAMKVMNEIPAGVSGVVKTILVDNGAAVEFGQPLFHVATD